MAEYREKMDLKKLSEPFPPEKIHWRVGATNGDKTQGIALAYVDARDVMQRLDDVCGRENWQCDYPWATDGKVYCRIGIKISGEWVWKGNGAGDTDVQADKGAFSDAFKRAGVPWGIAQYLYGIPNTWVKIVPKGRSYAIADSEKSKLAKLLGQTFEQKFNAAKATLAPDKFHEIMTKYKANKMEDIPEDMREPFLKDCRREAAKAKEAKRKRG